MAAVAIVGKSGTGKSTSLGSIPELHIKGLNPKSTVVINVSGKDLPFRGWTKLYSGTIKEGGNYIETSDADTISKAIKYISDSRPDIKDIVIDDAQYIMAFEFMRRAKENGLVCSSCKTCLTDWKPLRAFYTPLYSNDISIVKERRIGQSAAKIPI